MNAVVEQSPISAYLGLTRREQRFVDHYVLGKSAAEAMRLVNKSLRPDSFRVLAHRLLQREDIKAAIRERTAEAIHDAGAAIVEVMRHQAACATSDISNLANPDGTHKAPYELDEATRMAVRSFEVEEVSTGGREGQRYRYQFWDKGKAGEFVGRALGYAMQPAASVNVDARSVHNTVMVQAGLPSVTEWLAGYARALPAPDAATSVPDRSVLPAPIHAGTEGSGTPVASCEVPGDRGST